TKLVWIETPTNPTLKIADIAGIAEAVKTRRQGVLLAVDNTFVTPYFQRPLSLGADLVVHSTTKYLNGHSDVVGGAVVLNDTGLRERLAFLQNAIGAVPSPMDCFLVLRGTKTLHVRMKRHEENALAVAEWLSRRKDVETVIYPGLREHPQHALAARQMRGFGGVLSCVLAGGLERARRFLSACPGFPLAQTLRRVGARVAPPAVPDPRSGAARHARQARHRRRLHPHQRRHRGRRGLDRGSRAGVRGVVTSSPAGKPPTRRTACPGPRRGGASRRGRCGSGDPSSHDT